VHAIRRFTVRPVLPAALRPLGDLATNLRWSWHQGTQELFASIDDELWGRSGHDPVQFLGTLSTARLTALAADESFRARVAAAHADLTKYLDGERWFQTSDSTRTDGPQAIAYFSAEFGITGVLPQYSGGLGILAGDHLKAASDMGVPIVAVGLFYRDGYFRQSLSPEGWQEERYPVNDPDGLPLTLLREDDGTVPYVSVGLPGGKKLTARIWIAQVGRVPLLLLDSDVTQNRGLGFNVTDRLYGGGADHRLLQEMLLGSGVFVPCVPMPASLARRSRRSTTATRDMPASSASSASASSPRTATSTSTARWRPSGPARCSPLTPRCRRASTGSPASWSPSTSAATTPASASRCTASSPSAPRTTPVATAGYSTWR
jgi:hypothetical protein